MQKRGQVTTFIILGILITTIIFILIYLNYSSIISIFKSEETEIPMTLRVVVDNINDCLELTSYDALYYIGVHGGYYNIPEESSITYFTERIPYYYLNNKIMIPKLNIIQNGISNHIEDNLGNCLELNEFRNQGFLINESNYSVNTFIEEKFVFVSLRYPIYIQKGGIKINLNKFDKKITSNFKEIYEISKNITTIYSETPGYICLTCIDQLTKNENIEINIYPSLQLGVNDENITWFYIKDDEYNLKDKNFTMIFVVED